MKQMTRTSDPYVEMMILNIIPLSTTSTSSSSFGVSEDRLSSLFRHLVDCEYDILTSQCTIKYDYHNASELLHQFDVHSIQVIGYQRTAVKVNLFPSFFLIAFVNHNIPL